MPATRNLCTALTTGATGAQAGIRLNRTPLHGGQGREGMLQLAAAVPAGATVLMTEKDAVKCRGFAGADWWFVELGVGLDRAAASERLALILERAGLTRAGVHLG